MRDRDALFEGAKATIRRSRQLREELKDLRHLARLRRTLTETLTTLERLVPHVASKSLLDAADDILFAEDRTHLTVVN